MVQREDGNTDSSSLSLRVKSNRNRVVHWCFTYNNYDKFGQNGPLFYNILKKWGEIFVFQEETGENGTKHFQGYIKLLARCRLSELKKINNECHWEECRNVEDSIRYCQKEESRTGAVYRYGLPLEVDYITELYPWQKEIEGFMCEKADKRSIIWVWDEKGCNGKTELLKYLVSKYGAIFTCGGKNSDIINLIYNNRKYMECTENTAVIWNLPRTVESGYISYNAIECIKDGIISNNKFECGSFICRNPHVLVFANCLPNRGAMTADRWKIFKIHNKELIKWEGGDESHEYDFHELDHIVDP